MSRPLPLVLPLGLLLAVGLSFPVVGNEAEPKPANDLPEVVRFDVSPDGYPPYVIIEEHTDGGERYSGIFWDVLEEVAAHAGFSIEAHKVPRKRVDQMLLDGYIDATPRAIEWTPEPERFLFTQPVVHLNEVFFTRRESDFVYREPADLNGRTIITHLGYRYPAIEHKFLAGNAARFDVQKHRDVLAYLMHNPRFDAAIADLVLGQWVIRQHGWEGEFKHAGNELTEYPFRLMVRDDWTSFVTVFDQHLDRLRRSGRLEEIRNRYR